MRPNVEPASQHGNSNRLLDEIAWLAQTASVEVNVQDESFLEESRTWLRAGTKLYVSHLPGQSWDATSAMCCAVRRAGFEPVPHLPARLVESAAALERILQHLARSSRPRGILLIAGDYPMAEGPYGDTMQVLATGALERHGFTEVSVAGHPEGHPKVDIAAIRRAELDKPAIAATHGLAPTVLTQFLFEPEPFKTWVNDIKARGVTAQLVCGLAGPAKITTLFRYAARCGVGASIRALGARPSTVRHLLGDHGPDRMLRSLAEARLANQCKFAGVHVFGFGGFVRTVKWLAQVAARKIALKDGGGFSS